MAAIPWIGQRSPSASFAASTTTYVYVGNTLIITGTEAVVNQTQRTAGVWANLFIYVPTNDRGATTFKSRINGANGNQLLSIGASATGEFTDAVNTDNVSAGDEINAQLVTGAGGTVLTISLVSSTFAGTSESVARHCSVSGDAVTVNGATRYYTLTGAIIGDGTNNGVEANVQHSSRGSFTYKHLFVNVQTNTKGGTSTFRFRVNGANGTGAIAIGAGVTGILEDTSGTDAVVSGDEVNFSLDYFADANTLRCYTMAIEETSGSSQGSIIGGHGSGATVGTSVTTYGFLGSVTASTTEANYATDLPVAATLSKATVFVIANTLVGDATIRSRKNAANGALLMTIGTAATGWFEDASNADTFAANDEFVWQVVTPGVGTSIVFNNLALLYTAVAGGAIVPILLSQYRRRHA